jgi:hypothetical protein
MNQLLSDAFLIIFNMPIVVRVLVDAIVIVVLLVTFLSICRRWMNAI